MSEISSGLVAVAWIAPSNYEWPSHFISLTEIRNGEPLVRLSDAEAIIAKLRDALSETEAYHKRMVAAKDAEIERLKNDLADALDMKVGKGPTALSWQADRIEKQSAALKLARDALENHQGNYVLSKKECQPIKEALAAIDEVLKGE